jgi:ribonuclease-3
VAFVDWHILQQAIGIIFRDLSLLQQAFIHSSYINENPNLRLLDNERLEFLGDALLSFIVAEKLYHEFSDSGEGELTEIRISFVRQETLAQLALELQLGDYLYLGKGEEATGGRGKQNNLADAFESLVGAIFLDQGLSTARDFILRRFGGHLERVKSEGIGRNYKALLQEFTQAKFKQLPTYRVVEASGPDHDKGFSVEVALGDKVLGSGSGKSKRAAEMEAARLAWENVTAGG